MRLATRVHPLEIDSKRHVPGQEPAMIISDEHRYVFVELPFTASTAISHELQKHYGGRAVMRKHSNYREFLKYASREQRSYFVFSGIRNPLDEAVSLYIKLKTDHRGNYTGQRKWVTRSMKDRYRWVQAHDPSFSEFFLHFYRLPFENWSSLDHHRFDFVYRLESLQDDFEELLRQIGLEPVRPLPVLHRTDEKGRWQDYYSPKTYDRARFVFGPMMEQWGYEFPADWNVGSADARARVIYRCTAFLKNLRRRLRRSEAPPATRRP